MCLNNRVRDHRMLIQIGLLLLVLANCARYFLHPGPVLTDRYTDFINGILYGLSIALLGWGVILNGRRRRDGGTRA